ncbi:MAG TPA: substrate-binding domain-containing protein [Candidatus Binatia bacterium]|nr:substrate-binding domain-containing protein [Candidatus Binatia bacterium]
MKKFAIFVLAMLLPSPIWPQTRKSTGIAELAVYNGSDREQVLYGGAKSEGKVVWYTSLAGDSYKAIARAFEAKYPGVRLETYRAGGTELVPRMIEEAKARRPIFDVLETTEDSLMISKESKLLRPYFSPYLEKYPDEVKDKVEKGLVFSTNVRESYLGFGYNKSQISLGAVPKGFDGLLHPELKGKLAITLNESSAKVIGAMSKIKGDGFVKKLKSQEIKAYTVSSAALVDMIAAGEIGASFHIFRNHALVSAAKGSSVGWIPMELVPTNCGGVALAAQSSHPHAALLLVDFLLNDAVKIFEKFQYGHPTVDYGFKRWYQDRSMPLPELEKETARWEKLAKEITQR